MNSQTTVLEVTGLQWASSGAVVERTLLRRPGVLAVTANALSQTANVTYDLERTSVAQLAGKSVAATKGTDPYFFLLQALQGAGVPLAKVEVQNLQHADGKAALEGGSVDAWVGLDPLMAASESTAGSKLLYRNINFNTYGLLDATDTFLAKSPDIAQVVVNAYEKARAWALKNPEKTVAILAKEAGIDPAVARKVILDRTNLATDPAPGEAQRKVLEVVGPFFVQSGDVPKQSQIDDALKSLLEAKYVKAADPR